MKLFNHEEEKKLLWRGQIYTLAMKKERASCRDHQPFTSWMNTFQDMELEMHKTSPKATMQGPHKSH